MAVPLRAPYRAEQNRIRLTARRDGGGRQRVAGGIDGHTADQLFIEEQVDAELAAEYRQNFPGRCEHFAADPVAG